MKLLPVILLCFSAILKASSYPTGLSKRITFMNKETYPAYEELSSFQTQSKLIQSYKALFSNLKSPLVCDLCNIAMDLTLWVFTTPDKNYTEFFKFAILVCTELDIERPEICKGIITAMTNEIRYALNSVNATGGMVCGVIFPYKCTSPDLPWNEEQWKVPLPKPPTSIPILPASHTSEDSLRVLQISDIHIDLKYQPGSQVDCSEPLCCRTYGQGGTDRSAGKWGSVGYCDLPYVTVENFLQTVSKEKFDYVLWTGDLPAHDVWGQSRESVLYLVSNVTSLLLKYFPDTPVYPALGNHESFPVNSFPPLYVTGYNAMDWLYDALAESWAPWLTKEALETVQKSGFYTSLIKPGLRLVSLNMNYCNDQNLWTLRYPDDPNGELNWLVGVLTKAEEKGEKVHIIGHIPPVYEGDCLSVWRNNYFDIITRFQKTVTAQFFGHTHKDQVEVIYEDGLLKKPVSVAYVSPSLTTFPNLNPGYRIYDVDSRSYDVLNHHTYVLYLSKANQPDATPLWEFEYSAKQAYNLTSLSASSWSSLYLSWRSGRNKTSFQNYFTYYYKGNTPASSCDVTCRKKLLCGIAAGNFTLSDCT